MISSFVGELLAKKLTKIFENGEEVEGGGGGTP